jgi:hypothetical protein
MLRWKAVKQNQAHGSQAQCHPGGALQRQGGLRNNLKGERHEIFKTWYAKQWILNVRW